MFLAAEFLPNWGGVGTYSVELAKALSKKADVHVVTLGRVKKGRLLYSRQDMESFFDGNVSVELIDVCDQKDTFIFNARMQLAAFRKLGKISRENCFDILHANFPQMPDLLLKLGAKIPFASITTLHTMIHGQKEGILSSGRGFLKMEFSEKSTLALYPFLRLSEELYLRRQSNYITVSNWMREEVRKNYPFISNMSVVHNGVDPNNYNSSKAEKLPILDHVKTPIVLFSSRLTVAKGLHFLIRAIPKILKQTENVHFVFSGAGPKEEWIRLLEDFGIDKRFYTFLGYVDYRLLPDLYSAADVFVSPSLYENLPTRILEAMSCESAVVSSNICAVPEAIKDGENGLLIAPGDVDGLAKDVALLVMDSDFRKKLGKAARQTILREFDWNNISDKTLQAYRLALH